MLRRTAFTLLLVGGACSSATARDPQPNNPGTSNDGGGTDQDASGAFGPDGAAHCEGLECKVPTCEEGVTTAIEGDVYDPAGKSRLYNVRVFVPNGDLEPFTDGVTACDRCSAPLTGKPVAITLTDERGHFRLENVPAGERVPLVIQIGKFRRKLELPTVFACKTTNVSDGVLTLPKNRDEGDIPRMAVVTGGYDELGCILRRMGIDDSEFGDANSDARIHVYEGAQGGGGGVVGGTAKPATDLWSSVDSLKKYDSVLLACEGQEFEDDKPAAAKQAMVDYASTGGRVFATHYHYSWIKSSPDQGFRDVATWNDPASSYGHELDDVDTGFPKGNALAKWLDGNGSDGGLGHVPIDNPSRNVASVSTNAQRWIYEPTSEGVRYFSFNAPVGKPEAQQCGRFAFTDIHARERLGRITLPTACDPSPMTPQELALEFMIFDLAACVQPDGEAPKAPPIK